MWHNVGNTTSPSLRTVRSTPSARHRLVMLPHAGGGASYYRRLATGIAPDVDVIVVQYPGREDRTTIHRRILLSHYLIRSPGKYRPPRWTLRSSSGTAPITVVDRPPVLG